LLRVDVNEPTSEIVPLLQQTLKDEWKVEALNSATLSDYVWTTTTGTRVQVERKQWGELLAGMDKVEEQLLRHLNLHPQDQHILLVEGVVVNHFTGSQVMKMTAKGLMVKGQIYSSRMKGLFAWLYQVQSYLQVIQTTTLGRR